MLDMPLSACIFPGMFWIALAATTQFSGPLPTDALAVFSPDDMPPYVQLAGINRFIATRTTVQPNGTPQDCGVERSGGDPKLDSLTCAIILKRARFHPSRWIDGSPAYAVIRTPVSWIIGGPPSNGEIQKAYPADMDISVSRLPQGAKSPTLVRLMLAVDENGRAIGCDESPSIPGFYREKMFPELVPIACRQVMSEYTAVPAKDPSGKPVHSVQNVSVGFMKGS